jgi:hypothetical protein
MKTMTNYLALATTAFAFSAGSLFAAEMPDEVKFTEGAQPPASVAGDAWCLVTRPATYKTVTEVVTVRPATFYMEVIPARFETQKETVMVSPESKRALVVQAKFRTERVQQLIRAETSHTEVIPARFEWVDEMVVVRPQSTRLESTEPTFKTVSEQVQIEPARTFWKKVSCDDKHDRVNADMCFCLCQTPAKFVTVTRQVLDRPADTHEVTVAAETKMVKVYKKVADEQVKLVSSPAEYATIEREVLDTPSSVEYQVIPARFETIEKTVEVAPATQKRVEIPAKLETQAHTVLDQPSTMVWRKYKCDCANIVTKYHEVPGMDSVSAATLCIK